MRTIEISKGISIKILQLDKDFDSYAHFAGMLNMKSIYFDPSYLLCAQKAEGYPVKFIVASDDNDFALVPYVWRKVNDLAFLKDETEEMIDIITPHEYSGIVTNIENPEKKKRLFSVLFKAIDDLCRENNVVTEFARFDPFTTDIALVKEHYDIRYIGQNAYVNLEQTNENILRSFNHSAQKNIKTAQRFGLQFSEAENVGEIDIFIDLYAESMKRLNATKYFHFNREYFIFLTSNCDGARFFIVRDSNGTPVAASILLYQGDTAHHHLTCYDPAALQKRPNDFMIYRLSLWAKEHGVRQIHLGGGAEPIRNFKMKFASGDVPYSIGYKIHNMNYYEKVCEAWRIHSGNHGKMDYFPMYRLHQ